MLPELLRAGQRSVLLDAGSLDEAQKLLHILSLAREQGDLSVDDLIPAAETVLVVGKDAAHFERFRAQIFDIISKFQYEDSAVQNSAWVVIPVIYNGADLAEVSVLFGMSVEEIVNRHVAANHTVAFTGFAPGFAYIAGDDPKLRVPRRKTPRHRIGLGAVGLADRYTGIYPRESPGGWQIIGRTEASMWDLSRETPALLQPGANVKFEVATESIEIPKAVPLHKTAPETCGHEVLEVLEPGFQTLLQDRGRPGYSSMGVSKAGAGDSEALELANSIVGNGRDCAALELGAGTFSALGMRTAVFTLTGAPRNACIRGTNGVRAIQHEQAFRLEPGETLECDPPRRGFRTMLGVRGGFIAKPVLGSVSRDTLSGIGPAPIQSADRLRAGSHSGQAVGFPGPARARKYAAADEVVELEIILGPRDDWFGTNGHETLLNTVWQVSAQSDRVGVRLHGKNIARSAAFEGKELPSEGLANGSIQVPADGQPVLFLADRPLTGGYPVIAVIAEHEIDRAAQLPPGVGVRFVQRRHTSDTTA